MYKQRKLFFIENNLKYAVLMCIACKWNAHMYKSFNSLFLWQRDVRNRFWWSRTGAVGTI